MVKLRKPKTLAQLNAGNKPFTSSVGPSAPGFTSQGQTNSAYPGATPKSGLPVDPVYDAQLGGLANKRDVTLGGLSGARTRGLLDYGYNASFDSSGNPTDLQFDPSNPYSRAALMLRTYNQQKAGNTTSYAARGQLYSGALQNAQDATAFQQGASEDQLKKGLIAFLAGNQQAGLQAGSDYEIGAGSAYGDKVTRAGATTPDPVSSTLPPVTSGPVVKGAAAALQLKKKKGKK